ncbi:MAG: YeeE/YedE thiosulfate transporter family protein, partial [Gemmatirosa sp.]
MTAPLTETGALGAGGALAAALLVGMAFGWCLERAGLGNARKLVAQFYLTDLAVFKVMFSAILTAMLGAFWLSRLGLLDLSLVHVPETWLAPQLVGGLLFGVGMATAGLCPGTACVSAATGRGDGAGVVLGFLLGVLATGAALPTFAGFFA